MTNLKRRAVRYILQRRLSRGGFCFYRLEEPNASDTYWALAALDILGVPCRDESTVRYLKSRQSRDGSFENLYSAYYILKSLAIRGERPDRDPSQDLEQKRRICNVEALPPGSTSIFRGLFMLVDLNRFFPRGMPRRWRRGAVDFIFGHFRPREGFGHPHPTLTETCQALMILKWLGYPMDPFEGMDLIAPFEAPLFGFVNRPGISPAFIEYIDAGVMTAVALSRKPRYRGPCVEFLRHCQNRSGGFSRTSHGGIATLEYTFMAVRALSGLGWTGESLTRRGHG